MCVGVWAAVKGRVRDQLCDRARYCDGEHYYCRRACAEWNGMVMINFILLAVLFTPLHLIFVGAYARGFFGYHAQAPGARLPRLCAWAAREPLAALVHAVAYACCLVALFALLRPMLATYGNPTWNHVVLYTSSGGGSKVEKVVVQGAGGPNFNTIYYPVGNADGVPMYGGEKGGGTSTLRREGGMWVAKGHAGVTRYQCKSDAAQPPETGWESLGWGSAPTLQIQKTYDEEESPRGRRKQVWSPVSFRNLPIFQGLCNHLSIFQCASFMTFRITEIFGMYNNTASVIFFIIRNYGILLYHLLVALVFMFILPIFFCVVLYYAAAVPFVRLLRETRAALRQARATLAAREPPL